MRTVSAGLSDVGRKRPHNEDSFLTDDVMGLYVVADGVGGHAKGEIASNEAVDQIAMWVRRHIPDVDAAIAKKDEDALWDVRRMLESGIQQACYMVFGMAQLDPEKKGMSTTMSILLLRGGHAFLGQVGDSRVYRLRGQSAIQMTEDHTLINYKLKHGLITAEEAKAAGDKNVITRAVGHKDYVQVDTNHDVAPPGDRYLLCTDGLHCYLESDAEVIQLMSAGSPATVVRRAIQLANDRGGKDNITALMAVVY
ncbi:MAG: protein phosphatase 2C domain-containing protein [Pseudomonadota bacterium]